MPSLEEDHKLAVVRDHLQGGMAVAWVDVSKSKRFSPEKFQKVNLFETDRMFCDVYCFEPGQEQTVHKHQGADKIYYVLEGMGLVLVGAERRELLPGMAAHASSGEEHAVQNPGPNRLVMLVFMAPHP
jgi:mannose-6-phosphate isomerase-like protein (cupin superfamily)